MILRHMITYRFFHFKQTKQLYLESVRQLCRTRISIIVFVRKFDETLVRNISSLFTISGSSIFPLASIRSRIFTRNISGLCVAKIEGRRDDARSSRRNEVNPTFVNKDSGHSRRGWCWSDGGVWWRTSSYVRAHTCPLSRIKTRDI